MHIFYLKKSCVKKQKTKKKVFCIENKFNNPGGEEESEIDFIPYQYNKEDTPRIIKKKKKIFLF